MAVVAVATPNDVGGRIDASVYGPPVGPAAPLVRSESRRLSSASADAPVFVEFLDFECEACGRLFPDIEVLRSRYGDRVQFVFRYFPLNTHFNAERAALAVEAASRQGAFEAMYRTMFETQATWGEQSVAHDALFRSFAARLGLDLARFDADYADPSTLIRVRQDRDDGRALGVNATPTFFLEGRLLRPRSFDDLVDVLEAALES